MAYRVKGYRVDPETIVELRRQLGWTQRRLACEIGTDPSTLSNWERGYQVPRQPSSDKIVEIAKYYGFQIAPEPERRYLFTELLEDRYKFDFTPKKSPRKVLVRS